ncbi:alpha/beta fold hydrolase [Umezawaea tangerina]|uniref:Pimeloyl-ACP methyl ester carboxylesterase n=1 Tax=Umezawaea tangerina TaxID=84725 RepID=A0A2T0SZP4_9PSEU|nr:alpha/beta hydrolase [Umezawaea tangerina]PRY38888.1 pimeloyl-ACP methyl ester carboxylesterase [Umezawaea tangerina]
MRKKMTGLAGVVATVVVAISLLSSGTSATVAQPLDAVQAVADTAAESVKPPSGYRSEFAEVNGFRMHYLRGGSGSPVVLVHGFPQTSAEWRPQLDALARDHTVIAVDLRGAGDSGVPADGYDTVQLATDIHALLSKLGLNNRVQVVAHDIGAWIAYPYAAMWPTEVSRVVVMEGPIVDDSVYQFPSLAPEGNLYVWHFGLFQKKLAEQLVRGHEREFVEGFVDQYLVQKKAFGPADYEFYARYLREPGRFHAWMRMYQAIDTDVRQTKQLREAGPLPMPVLAIGGEKALAGGVGAQWSTYATNVETRVLADTGHWVTEERPQELTDLLLGFLR